jgi:hypothetical protein
MLSLLSRDPQAATLSCGNAACESLTNREFKAIWPVEETVYPYART